MGTASKKTSAKNPWSIAKSVPPRPPPTSSNSKKGAPNASILSFFKKVPAPEETLFVGDAGSVQVAPVDDTDIYGVDDAPAERYNESESPVKKRKLSDGTSSADGRPQLSALAKQSPEPPLKTPKPAPSRKSRPKGPFLDDDDSDDNTDEVEQPSVKKSSPQPSTVIGAGPSNENSPSPVSPTNIHRLPDLIQEEQEHDDFRDFEDMMDQAGEMGEEGWERIFMEEQARIEAQEAEAAEAFSRDHGSGKPPEAEAAECCPICSSSLAGVTPEQATIHVNSCLDGNPTPLPTPSKPADTPKRPIEVEDEVDSDKISKRFARAAVARPGQANPITLDDTTRSTPNSKISAFSKLMSGHAESTAWAAAAAAEQSSRGRQAYERTCPFYKIMPGISICVDAFRYGAVQGCNAYFLSHFHSDHYIGLTANWRHGPIYCSKVTGSLVRSQLRTAAKYVVDLEFEEPFVVPGTDDVTVTMIPANHCPGSSLFLFEKTMGKGHNSRVQRILHCGDFRACPAHVGHPKLKPETINRMSGKVEKQKIDVCYLDTTYLNPRYSFPPQEDVIQSCAALCAALNRGMQEKDESVWNRVLRRREGVSTTNDVSHFFVGTSDITPTSDKLEGNPPSALTALDAKYRLLVVCGTYSIGKERICKAIAQALRTKIFASPHKIRIVTQLGDPELTALMTSNPAEAQVHMQMLSEIRAETLADYLTTYRKHFGRVVGFRPSGWNYRPVGTAANANAQPGSVQTATLLHGGAWRPTYRERDLVPQRGSSAEAMCFGVPYSEHSSFRELAMFLMGLNVEKVVPTVNVGSEVGRKRMKAWTDRWLAERRRGGLVRVLEGEGEDGGGLWDGKSGKGGGVRW